MKAFFKQFTKFDIILFFISLIIIIVSFFACGNDKYVYLATSITGLLLLTFVAKGSFIGQIFTIIFAVLYGVVSYSYKYYGEMITYLGMSAPIAVAALISWIRNPAKGEIKEVEVNSLSYKEYIFLSVLSLAVTAVFGFILSVFHTANLILSTVSVWSSFTAAYLTLRRSRFYAIAYAINDIILIALWTLASVDSPQYIAMVVNFVVFLVNDTHGFINWTKMQLRQKKSEQNASSEQPDCHSERSEESIT